VRAKKAAHKRRKKPPARECNDWCALFGWQSWRSQHLTPSYNWLINFAVPAGKVLVIELVTASIEVPVGEAARLRMYTSLGSTPSNLDLALMPQGVANLQHRDLGLHAIVAGLHGRVARVQRQPRQRGHGRRRADLRFGSPGHPVAAPGRGRLA